MFPPQDPRWPRVHSPSPSSKSTPTPPTSAGTEARLFALVDTDRLRVQEPGLAAQLGLEDPGSSVAALTPIEQDELPPGTALDEFLATIAWPDAVVGCAMTVERLMLPPSAEASVPDDLSDQQLTKWVAKHPDRQEVRMTVAVLRDGARESAVRLREKDSPTEVLTGATWCPVSPRRSRRRSSPDRRHVRVVSAAISALCGAVTSACCGAVTSAS